MLGPCFCGRVLGVLSGSNLAIILLEKSVWLLYFNCALAMCSVSFYHSVMGWSAFFDCDISCAHSFEPRHVISNNVAF